MIIICNKKTQIRIAKVTIGVVTLIIGGLIYIIYRSETLLMFDWFRILGISRYIDKLRATDYQNIYEWVKNSLPAGLWLFSYMFIIDSVWEKDKCIAYKFYIYVLPVLAVLSEFMQYIKILPGTFDINDLLSYFFAILLYLLIKKL